MGFSNQERINLFTKALAAGVYDANATAVWYESKFPFTFALDGESIWTQLASVPPAANLATARANALANPTVIEDLSQIASATRLTLVAGTNQSTYAAYQIYNDPSSPLLLNWILPQLVPQSSGTPSIGYAISLYNGNPATGGTLITTTDGTTGTGINKTVGWIFNYASGLLILSDDFKGSITDPWIVGFRYIGTTANDVGTGAIGGSIDAPEVAYANAHNNIIGDPSFIYDDTNALLEVEKIKSQYVYEVRNESGATIEAGTCVTLSGVTPSGKTLIIPADASDPTKICKGIVPNQIPDGNNGYVVILGLIHSLDGSVGNHHFDETITSADIGKIIYVSPSNPGRITITRPTLPTEFVQSIGCISNVNGTNVTIEIVLSKPNDVPNEFSISGNIDTGSLTINSSYTFPTTDGLAGQSLISDGAGNLSFAYLDSVESFTADEAIAIGQLVKVVNSDDIGFTLGRIILANASEMASSDLLGVAVSAGIQGDTILVASDGKVSVEFLIAPIATDVGQKVFISTTDGLATLIPPSATGDTIYKVGTLLHANGVSTNLSVKLQFQEIMYLG